MLGDRFEVVADQGVDDLGHHGVALRLGIEEAGPLLDEPDQGVEGRLVSWRVLGHRHIFSP